MLGRGRRKGPERGAQKKPVRRRRWRDHGGGAEGMSRADGGERSGPRPCPHAATCRRAGREETGSSFWRGSERGSPTGRPCVHPE